MHIKRSERKNYRKKTLDFYDDNGKFIESMDAEEIIGFIMVLEDMLDQM